MGVRLSVISGLLAGQEFQLVQSEFGIGRTPDNAICIPNPAVSRTHARVFHRDGIWECFTVTAFGTSSICSQRTGRVSMA